MNVAISTMGRRSNAESLRVGTTDVSRESLPIPAAMSCMGARGGAWPHIPSIALASAGGS